MGLGDDLLEVLGAAGEEVRRTGMPQAGTDGRPGMLELSHSREGAGASRSSAAR